jgi:hypothetical protein
MKVFISFSGDRAKTMANSLAEWLPNLFPSIEPFVSTAMEGGIKWFEDLAGTLSESRFGIICLTLDSYRNPWVNFEAGALLTAFNGNQVCPYYLDGTATDYLQPLSMLNMLKADREGSLRLVKSLSAVLERAELPTHKPSRLDNHFDIWWPKLESRLVDVQRLAPTSDKNKPGTEALLREILTIVRGLQTPKPQNAEKQATRPAALGDLLREKLAERKLSSVVSEESAPPAQQTQTETSHIHRESEPPAMRISRRDGRPTLQEWDDFQKEKRAFGTHDRAKVPAKRQKAK